MSTGYVKGGERVTRRPHPCSFCLTEIPPGRLTRWWVWADAGFATTSYAHYRCVEMNKAVNLFGDELMDPGEFRDACIEAWPGRDFPWSTELPT